MKTPIFITSTDNAKGQHYFNATKQLFENSIFKDNFRLVETCHYGAAPKSQVEQHLKKSDIEYAIFIFAYDDTKTSVFGKQSSNSGDIMCEFKQISLKIGKQKIFSLIPEACKKFDTTQHQNIYRYYDGESDKNSDAVAQLIMANPASKIFVAIIKQNIDELQEKLRKQIIMYKNDKSASLAINNVTTNPQQFASLTDCEQLIVNYTGQLVEYSVQYSEIYPENNSALDIFSTQEIIEIYQKKASKIPQNDAEIFKKELLNIYQNVLKETEIDSND
ncbi:MAG: hypothetical protein FWC41_10135, partial [Firmicutes bacterium]|nr:hypothetical protein [Bacillota bacterium]